MFHAGPKGFGVTPPASAVWRFNFYLMLRSYPGKTPPTLVAWSFNFGHSVWDHEAEGETPRD